MNRRLVKRIGMIALCAVATRGPTASAELEPWQTTLGYPELISSRQSAVWGDRIYCLGGQASKIGTVDDLTGEVLSWIDTTPHTVSGGAAVVAHNEFIYVVGGATAPATSSSYVEFAPINPDGTLGSWQQTSSLARESFQGRAVVFGNHIYSVGGAGADPAHPPTVQIAEINPDGSLGTWIESPSQMSIGHADMATLVHDGQIYVIGGGLHSVYTSVVERSVINADGTLGAWQLETPLPEIRAGHGAVVLGTRLLVLGGHLAEYGANKTTTVLSSWINPDGSLQPWQEDESLPSPAGNRIAETIGSRVYVHTLPAPAEVVFTLLEEPIPTVSEWGLVVTMLLVLTAGSLLVHRGRHLEHLRP